MPSIAKDYFNLMAKPTVEDFINNPHDLRRGLLSALILNHMVDHLAQEDEIATERCIMNKRVNFKRREMLNDCPDFQLIWDIADATKHAKLANQKRKVSASSQISSTPGLFYAPFGEGTFGEAVVVYAVFKDGEEKPLLPVIKSAFEALQSKIIT